MEEKKLLPEEELGVASGYAVHTHPTVPAAEETADSFGPVLVKAACCADRESASDGLRVGRELDDSTVALLAGGEIQDSEIWQQAKTSVAGFVPVLEEEGQLASIDKKGHDVPEIYDPDHRSIMVFR